MICVISCLCVFKVWYYFVFQEYGGVEVVSGELYHSLSLNWLGPISDSSQLFSG